MGIVGMNSGSITGMQTYAGPAMTETTTLDNAIQFLRAFGFFNVVLPFLLIFTIVFGVLEKTKIFGTEKFKDETVPRRNLNSVVSFCIAFFVVAASNVVELLQVSLPIIALVLVAIIVFLLLFGSMMNTEELKEGISLWKAKGFKRTFVTIISLAVLAILLAGFGLLDDLVNYVGSNLTGTFITSLVLLIILVGAIWFVAGSRDEKKEVK
jgi:uncharacterized membrane protein YecN with MAPEG domain